MRCNTTICSDFRAGVRRKSTPAATVGMSTASNAVSRLTKLKQRRKYLTSSTTAGMSTASNTVSRPTKLNQRRKYLMSSTTAGMSTASNTVSRPTELKQRRNYLTSSTTERRESQGPRLPGSHSSTTSYPSFIAVSSTSPSLQHQTHWKNIPSIVSTSFTPIEHFQTAEGVTVAKLPEFSKVLLHSNGVIECLDQGNFPHPSSCKKFISCADMGVGRVLGWEYMCPKNLSFDPIGGICNWSAGSEC